MRSRSTTRPRVGIVAVMIAVVASGCERGDSPSTARAAAPTAHEQWRSDEDAAFAEAAKTGRHVVIDFRATWCEPCKQIEAILSEDEVHAEVTQSFVPLEFDISDLTPEDNERKAKYKAFALPAVIFVSASGEELGRIGDGVSTSDEFVARMRRVLAEHPAPGE